jgi:2-polyprenyl-3-methyl-5-hydroxy-6-metoxy-1,4-benzoquinol methylase
MSRVICGDCDIVFANPMADAHELDAFYTNYYQHGNMKLLDYTSKIIRKHIEVKALTYEALTKEADFVYQYKKSGRFLDVGCGLGIGLLFVDRPEFELYATELDADSLTFVKANYANVTTFQGELIDAHYPDNYFDYVYCNHVIEHVLDPITYMKEMYRILKKDGILYVGTPDRKCILYKLYRSYRFLLRSVPQIVDGIEHTFIFSKKNLRSLALKEGFKIESQKSIPLGDSIKNIFTSEMNFKKKVTRYIQTYFKINQVLICKK